MAPWLRAVNLAFVFIFLIVLVSAPGIDNPYLPIQKPIPSSISNGTLSVNNSLYWNSYPWSNTRWLNIDGANANQDIDIGSYDFGAENILGDGTGSYFNKTLLIDGDAAEMDATLVVRSHNNLYACINLTEGGNLGFSICNDGAGSNRLVFANLHDGYEWMWIDRDDGTINFLNDTVFSNIVVDDIEADGDLDMTGHDIINVGAINATTGNFTDIYVSNSTVYIGEVKLSSNNETLYVDGGNGTVVADYFEGDGSKLTGLNLSGVNGSAFFGDNVTVEGDFIAEGNSYLANAYINYIDFNLTAEPPHQTGRMHWSEDDSTLEVGMVGSDVVLQIGQEQLLYAKNKVGSTIFNGQAVYISGSSGAGGGFRPLIKYASNDDSDTFHVAGVVTEPSIINNGWGYITVKGIVRDLDTSAWSEGDTLYLGTGGNLTNIHPPLASNGVVVMGIVLKDDATTGSIYVNIKEYTLGNNHNGTLRQSVINKNDDELAGASFTAVNDLGHRTSLSIFSSGHSTLPNVTGLYSSGYGETAFVNDGDEDFAWYADPNDYHNFSSLNHETMRLSSSGDLDVNSTIRAMNNMVISNSTPSASFRGQGDLYGIGSAKFMEGLYAEAKAYGAGLEILDNNVATTYTNVFTGTAALDATSQIIYDPAASFDSSYKGQFFRVISSTPSFTGATGEITSVINSTYISISFATAGSDTIVDATGMRFVVYPHPRFFVGDNGVVSVSIGPNPDAKFEVHIENGTGFHGVYIEDAAGADQHQALTVDVDSKDYDGVVGLNIFMSSSTGVDGISSDAISLEGDATGFNNSLLHFIDVSLIGAGNDNDVDIIHVQGIPNDQHLIHAGSVDILSKAYYDNGIGTTTDVTTAFTSQSTDVTLFENYDSIVYIGNDLNFTSIAFSLSVESNRYIRPEYYYCDSSDNWVPLTGVTDTTSGMEVSGTISFINPADRGTCNDEMDGTPFADTNDYTYIAIRRIRTNWAGDYPVENLVTISGGGDYFVLQKNLLKLVPTDSSPETCDFKMLGAMYFDISEDDMCQCASGGWEVIRDGSACT